MSPRGRGHGLAGGTSAVNNKIYYTVRYGGGPGGAVRRRLSVASVRGLRMERAAEV